MRRSQNALIDPLKLFERRPRIGPIIEDPFNIFDDERKEKVAPTGARKRMASGASSAGEPGTPRIKRR